ncbi:tRNA1(Val) (adenine(37)-N6)-methyltransferase [Parapedobacter tibetensis]|uniref:tRNA1(Val) (adenine(37)-N6)-methyltransferase n=1 Tax=Parapedobacter tibetensis TaxID=2972951 RepID=UPI00214D2B2B|nr:methyltransferase [Parapedobacter tibetensis]
MSSVFKFKQFEVDQSGCAMKINTDGVLLGAMSTAKDPLHILDIGTGTGVIALMLAQRHPWAKINAIELDSLASKTAQQNFDMSPFFSRLACENVALGDFETDVNYDLIVSNPPYFLRSLRNPDERKRVARHTDMSFFDDLLARSEKWLTYEGSLQLVLPSLLAADVGQKALDEYGLMIQWEVGIRSFVHDSPIRRILALGKTPKDSDGLKDDFVIYESKGVYSDSYKELLKDFFLGF